MQASRPLRGLALAALVVAILAAPADAAYPGANGRIAFVRATDIYSIRPGGTGLKRLTSTPGLDVLPAWSPDGKRIAFASDRDREDNEIYVMNANGSGQHALTANFRVDDHSPTWSPDGKRIAFVRDLNDPNGEDVWVMNADGSGAAPILSRPGFDNSPAWSPDGRLIAFESRGAVWVVRPDGTGLKRLAGGGAPSWAPGGAKLAFARGGEIFVVRRNGSKMRRLTRNKALDFAPAWSPDGTRIVFQSDRDSLTLRVRTTELYAMRVDGSRQTRLTRNRVDDVTPDWQPLAQVRGT